jgi:hypothetical protein
VNLENHEEETCVNGSELGILHADQRPRQRIVGKVDSDQEEHRRQQAEGEQGHRDL